MVAAAVPSLLARGYRFAHLPGGPR